MYALHILVALPAAQVRPVLLSATRVLSQKPRAVLISSSLRGTKKGHSWPYDIASCLSGACSFIPSHANPTLLARISYATGGKRLWSFPQEGDRHIILRFPFPPDMPTRQTQPGHPFPQDQRYRRIALPEQM